MKLNAINNISGTIELVTGLHIGAGNDQIRIGGIDNPVICHPFTLEPYIPGSSLKGKMRSLLEWRAGVVGSTNGKPVDGAWLKSEQDNSRRAAGLAIARLFGIAGDSNNPDLAAEVGPSRLSFWDCGLEKAFAEEIRNRGQLFTEAKFENSIDRIKGVATNPRQTERVPAGSRFAFRLSLKCLENDPDNLLETLLAGMRLLELEGIGGSGSRGYGKISFTALALNGDATLLERLQAIDPFVQQGAA